MRKNLICLGLPAPFLLVIPAFNRPGQPATNADQAVRAAARLTLLRAASFNFGGFLRVVFSLAVCFPAWSWVLLNGVVDLLLGFLIWNGWPESSLWVIGLFVGIDLIFHGVGWVMLGLGVRAYHVAPSVGLTRATGILPK